MLLNTNHYNIYLPFRLTFTSYTRPSLHTDNDKWVTQSTTTTTDLWLSVPDYQVSRYQKDKPLWILLKQKWWGGTMAVASVGPYASHLHKEYNDPTMGIYLTKNVKVWVFVIHVNFNIRSKLRPKVCLHITAEWVLYSKLYSIYSSQENCQPCRANKLLELFVV